MLFSNACYLFGLVAAIFLIIFGISVRKRLEQKSASASLLLAGGCGMIWSALGEILYWSNVIPRGCESLKPLIGGIAAGILINMVITRQTDAFGLDLFNKRGNSS
jgi:hypothetical protein